MLRSTVLLCLHSALYSSRWPALRLWAAASGTALAGPPFQTDDPEPVDLGHYEFYVFAASDGTPLETDPVGPAFEFNWGALPNTQLHAVLNFGAIVPSNNPLYAPQGSGPSAYGLLDTELGVKYRFIPQSAAMPEVGVFPMIELPTGSDSRGLGVGKTWYKLPLWIQKDFGPWTTYGGGGYQIVDQVGYSNFRICGPGCCNGTSVKNGPLAGRFGITVRRVQPRPRRIRPPCLTWAATTISESQPSSCCSASGAPRSASPRPMVISVCTGPGEDTRMPPNPWPGPGLSRLPSARRREPFLECESSGTCARATSRHRRQCHLQASAFAIGHPPTLRCPRRCWQSRIGGSMQADPMARTGWLPRCAASQSRESQGHPPCS